MGKDYKVIKGLQGAFPLGTHIYKDYVHFSVEAGESKKLVLCLYNKDNDELETKISFPEENRLGDVRYIDVEGIDVCCTEYSFEYADGKAVKDVYAKKVSGWEEWGDLSRNTKTERYGFAADDFEWKDDSCPNIPINETIIYRLHVRGFTKHTSSKISAKGTFAGVKGKLQYLKELGITSVELMNPVEFNEVRKLDYNPQVMPEYKEKTEENSLNINYWGYGDAYYFAPKAAFAVKDSVSEFKELVRAAHKLGLEIIMELNFAYGVKTSYVLEVLRYWAENYHIDGFRLGGNAALHAVAEDGALKKLKLFAQSWDGCEQRRNLITYNNGFMNDMRRFLKGDENTLNNCLRRMTDNPSNGAVVNYFADNNTFTMMDMVSYDVKHNEANGENNRDGEDYNFSWNCGVEGATKKKKIAELRRQQLFNAYAMLFLSQGIPMLRAGDEMGQSKGGNNNAYCQDNQISWVNWRQLSSNKDIYEFVKAMIAFRKSHSLFGKDGSLKETDYNSVGLPEFSVHGVNPWYPQFEHYRRQLGLLYYGEYEMGEDKSSYYLMINMHWEPHEFIVPKVPEKGTWQVIVDSSAMSNVNKSEYVSEKEGLVSGTKAVEAYEVKPRSLVLMRMEKNKKI